MRFTSFTVCSKQHISYGETYRRRLSRLQQQSNNGFDEGLEIQLAAAELHLASERISNEARTGSPGAASAPNAAVRLPTGTSLAIREVIAAIRQVAAFDSTALVLGESGTGKEVVARAIHDMSPRRGRPFVAVNCGAIPTDLLESELFGHEKGSFTGAIAARKGRFEIAEGGSLFLDEIGDMSPSMQVKLLRVLQERVFERVGNHAQIKCNVRIIAATHRNLEESIARGTFREDLFHRINVFPIEVPPLRSRSEDIPLLIRDFVAQNVAEGRGRLQLSPRALAALALHSWSGNVRELSNLVERLSIVCGNRVAEVRDLPPKYRPPEDWTLEVKALDTSLSVTALEDTSQEISVEAERLALNEESVLTALESEAFEPSPLVPDRSAPTTIDAASPFEGLTILPKDGIDLRAHLLAIERRLVEQALERADGTVAQAARLLNLRRTTLVEKLRKLGIADVDSLP
jgi:sigma-54 dependent transcriptional regulator, flagellar regulatory protein